METKDRDVAPSCQIPWAILHQVFVKWKHTRLPEDVQNQRRSQEMTMIHRVLIMNIIHALARGDNDEIRPSDVDDKLLYMLAFSPVYRVCQMYIWLYIHIYGYIFTYITKLAFHLCWVILSIELFWHDFTLQITLKLIDRSCRQAFDSSSDLTSGRFQKYFYQSTHTSGIIHATPQNDHTNKDRLLENCS